MKALIDGDIFQYEFGSMTDDEFKPLGWPIIQNKIQNRIDQIMEATGAKTYQIYLTSDDKSNFRYKLATIRPYKGHRSTEKPHWYYHIRNFLVDYRGAQEVSGIEADDAISMAQYEALYGAMDDLASIEAIKELGIARTVICSRDKDLNMVPGLHYTWECGKQKEKPLWWQDEVGGFRCFYKQLLMGDTCDNILGLFGVGQRSKIVSSLDDVNSDADMYRIVFNEYEKRFGSYAKKFLIENARLLWMLRSPDDEWVPPPLEGLEK